MVTEFYRGGSFGRTLLGLTAAAAVFAWGSSALPCSGAPAPSPTPVAGVEAELGSRVSREEASKLIPQLAALKVPVRVLLYSGTGEVSFKTAPAPSDSFCRPAESSAQDNIILNGRPLNAGHYEFSPNGKEHTDILSCAPGRVIAFRTLAYRGCMQVSRRGGKVEVVNYVSMEDYLRGVVPKELLCSSIEAMKAQAVAARTYAEDRRIKSTDRWDLASGTSSQVYGGAGAESVLSDKAVAETAGQVLSCDGRTAGEALYHSSCGGATENSDSVFGTHPVAYLRGVSCLDDKGVPDCAASPHSSWEYSWTGAELAKELSSYLGHKCDTVIGMKILGKGGSGRVSRLGVYFRDGSWTEIKYEDIRQALRYKNGKGGMSALPSTCFEIVGGDLPKDDKVPDVSVPGGGPGVSVRGGSYVSGGAEAAAAVTGSTAVKAPASGSASSPGASAPAVKSEAPDGVPVIVPVTKAAGKEPAVPAPSAQPSAAEGRDNSALTPGTANAAPAASEAKDGNSVSDTPPQEDGIKEKMREKTAEIMADKRVFTVKGRGWGHGAGMCQWGAMGMAKRGLSYKDILSRYYKGTQVVDLAKFKD